MCGRWSVAPGQDRARRPVPRNRLRSQRILAARPGRPTPAAFCPRLLDRSGSAGAPRERAAALRLLLARSLALADWSMGSAPARHTAAWMLPPGGLFLLLDRKST